MDNNGIVMLPKTDNNFVQNVAQKWQHLLFFGKYYRSFGEAIGQ